MSYLSLHEHNHPEGSLADIGDCPKCDAVYWNPHLVASSDPRPDGLTVAIMTTFLVGLVFVALTLVRWIA